jgi:multisubunit Na+/H+ antiporter MnhB subunit
MKKLEAFFDSEHFLLIVVIVLIMALFIHTTIVIYTFSPVESDILKLLSALLFSIPLGLLVMVFTLHKSNEKDWEFDASGWLATGTAFIFIIYMEPWTDIIAGQHMHHAALKVLIGSMIGVGEYALPRLYRKIKNQTRPKRYVCGCEKFETDSKAEFMGHISSHCKDLRINHISELKKIELCQK